MSKELHTKWHSWTDTLNTVYLTQLTNSSTWSPLHQFQHHAQFYENWIKVNSIYFWRRFTKLSVYTRKIVLYALFTHATQTVTNFLHAFHPCYTSRIPRNPPYNVVSSTTLNRNSFRLSKCAFQQCVWSHYHTLLIQFLSFYSINT